MKFKVGSHIRCFDDDSIYAGETGKVVEYTNDYMIKVIIDGRPSNSTNPYDYMFTFESYCEFINE